jgi:hypothetical protein
LLGSIRDVDAQAGIVLFAQKKTRLHDVDLTSRQPSLFRKDKQVIGCSTFSSLSKLASTFSTVRRNGPLTFCWNFNHLWPFSGTGGLA